MIQIVIKKHWFKSSKFFTYFSTAKKQTQNYRRQKTYYQILEVPSSANSTAIKKNFLKLAKIYHPDVYKGADRNRFQKLQQAYKVLSVGAERKKYDEKIGLKSNFQYQQSNKKSSEQKGNEYGKNPNDFKYSVHSQKLKNINIDEQYEKFFNKKGETNFEEIRLHEQNQFKAMSQSQRIRRRFKEVYTNENYIYKMRYSKSYPQILDDQINQKNQHEKQQQKKKAEYQAKYTKQGIEFRMKLIKIGGFIVFLIMVPFILSFRTKYNLQKKSHQDHQKIISSAIQKVQQLQVRSRMRFN